MLGMAVTRIDEQVRAALQQRRGYWPTIAKEAGVSHSWLSKFVRHQIGNPGYATLVRLDQYLNTAAGRRPSVTGEG
jgi:transcriptional regulator with XRE-family HTH domain